MISVVLDTDVVSFLLKRDTRARLYLPYLRDRQSLISSMTEAELEQWALLANWGINFWNGFEPFFVDARLSPRRTIS